MISTSNPRSELRNDLQALFNFESPGVRNDAGLSKMIWGYSSAGRAPALQAGGLRFDPAYLHQQPEKVENMGLVRTKR